MGILTNFLKLLKPEPNDFVDVAKHISENYDKLDLNAKSNNETLTNLSNNKLDKGTYSGNASNLKSEIDKIASTTQLGRIKVGDNLTIDTAGRLSGNPAVDIRGKMDKYQVRDDIRDYDDLTENGFYILAGSKDSSPSTNAPYGDPALVQVWNYGGYIYQNAVSYYDVKQQFTRCFYKEVKNTKWEKIVNTTDIVNNLTTTAPGQVLDARQGPAIVNKINGLAGGYSGTFPLTTAVKEGIYLLPATNKFYVCVENYSGSSLTAPNANFEELSVFQNRNKLQNLANKNEFKALKNFPLNTIKLTQTPQEFSLTLEEMKALEYVVVYDVDFIKSSQSKFIFGNLARAEDGEYWVQVPSGEEINFHVFENKLYMSADSGSRPVCISSIFYR